MKEDLLSKMYLFLGVDVDCVNICGSTSSYFTNNLEEIEKFIKISSSKTMLKKNKVSSHQALATFLFNEGIKMLDGQPLSVDAVRRYLRVARQKRKGAVVAVKATAPVVAHSKQENPVQAVLVPSVAVSVVPGAVPGRAPGGVWTKQDYDVVAKQLKESGWSHKFFEEKAVFYFGLYETNNYKNIPWNDELENLWIITQSRFADAYDKMSDRYYYNIKGSLTYGVLAEFLINNRPKQ